MDLNCDSARKVLLCDLNGIFSNACGGSKGHGLIGRDQYKHYIFCILRHYCEKFGKHTGD